jgi:diguanylate cyclase (GGDEF)-like protein/hemerythrin-like metal-binding protein/PAS domain S-box-containing protein
MKMVEVFPWNENFATGIAQIDEQHKCLIQLLNLLASHLAYQSDVPALNNIFNELAEYAVYHFHTEEIIWQQYLGHDEWETEHKNVHHRFVDEIMALKAEENAKPFEGVIEDVLSFLTHWLAFHILESDKRMAKTVLAIQSGLPLAQAKQQAEERMSGAIAVLIETILNMYDSLSSRTLQLMREVTERQKAEAKLRLAANVFDNTLDAICITDANFTVLEVNPSFYQVTAYSEAEILGKNLCLSKSGLLDKKISPGFWNILNQNGHWSGIINNRRKSGEIEAEWLTLSMVKNDADLITNYVAVFSNVSHLIEQQQTLERIAHHDALTGLPNRLLLPDRLELAIAHAERTRTSLAICYLDLDGFKPVNDQLGHAAGDYLLREIAQRFLSIMRDNDTVARLGGDEFVILIGDLKNSADYAVLLKRVLIEISRPVQIQDKTVQVSVSIGVTLFPADKSDPEALLHHADQAMYQAKQQGKSRYCLYAA